jgi:lipopolysaccharide/colanic/teichoic acid biosynthesis glycosyltransferase
MKDETQYVVLSPEDEARRRKRSIAIALSLAGLVVLILVTTIVRLGGNLAQPRF